MLRYSLILLAAASVSLFAHAAPAAAQADCQTTDMDTGQGVVRQTMCRGADGVWRPQQATTPAAPGAGLAVGGGAFPQGWSGRVTYTGTYQGAIETPGRPMRRFTLDEAVRSATSGSREEIGGPYTLELTIEGNAVSGRLTATRGVRSANVSGTRNGDRCRLFIGDVSIEAECTASRFDGRARTQGNARRIYNYRIDTEATRVVDNRAEAARREQAAAESRGAARPSQAQADDWAFAFGEHIRCGALLSVAGLYGNTDRYQNLATTSISRAMTLAGEAGLSRPEASELVRTVGFGFSDQYTQEPPTPDQIAQCETMLR